MGVCRAHPPSQRAPRGACSDTTTRKRTIGNCNPKTWNYLHELSYIIIKCAHTRVHCGHTTAPARNAMRAKSPHQPGACREGASPRPARRHRACPPSQIRAEMQAPPLRTRPWKFTTALAVQRYWIALPSVIIDVVFAVFPPRLAQTPLFC